MQVTHLKTNHIPDGLIDSTVPVFSYIVESTEENAVQAGYEITLWDDYGKVLWKSGFVSSVKTFDLPYKGKRLSYKSKYFWAVTVTDQRGNKAQSAPASFLTPLKQLKGKPICNQETGRLPLFHKTYRVKKNVKKAILYPTALGCYDLRVNGVKPVDHLLAPGWTDYRIRTQYQGYEVTELITDKIELTVRLGNGWYAGNVASGGPNQYGGAPLVFQMDGFIEYSDGTTEKLRTDESWKTALSGLVTSDIQDGEIFDCALEPSKGDWHPVSISEKQILGPVPQSGPEILFYKAYKPVSCHTIKDALIFDMGQNMAAVPQFRLHGQKGQKITLRYGEMLNPDGSLYTENLRSAKQTDVYYCKKGENQHTTFCLYHGFRYVEVTGTDQMDFTALVYFAGTEQTGWFTSSDPMLNQLYSNIVWGQRGNFYSVPTDCPQRDERMGWTGDTQVFAPTAIYNMDCQAYYRKYLIDLVDTQDKAGAYGDVAPMVHKQNGDPSVPSGNPAWADCGIILPWLLYTYYGDKEILKKHYVSMEKYFTYTSARFSEDFTRNPSYGDWLSVDETTDIGVFSLAYFGYIALLMEKISYLLKKDAACYTKKRAEIQAAFAAKYVKNNRVLGDTQTSYLLPIVFDLVDQKTKEKFARRLNAKLKERNYRLTTGFIGVSYLLPVLSEYGYSDTAWKVLLQTEYPSWFYSIQNGATTLWERWNSYTKEAGFGDVSMNSFNHYSLGSCGRWLFENAAGIKPLTPGFTLFEIKPELSKDVDFIQAAFRSPSGMIKVYASKKEIRVTIPFNTTAHVWVPKSCKSPLARMIENSTHIAYCLGSGTYRFVL